MLTLYYGPGTCSLVAHIALRISGERFNLHRVEVFKGEQNTPEYRRVNVHGRVPVLDLGDGRRLTESTVVATYIAETFPSSNLLPTDRYQLYRGRELMTWANTTLHATTFARLFRPGRFVPDEALHDALKDAGAADLSENLAYVEERVSGRDWGAPDQTTITDLFLYVYGRWAGRVGHDMDQYPAYSALIARVGELPATKAALAEEGLT